MKGHCCIEREPIGSVGSSTNIAWWHDVDDILGTHRRREGGPLVVGGRVNQVSPTESGTSVMSRNSGLGLLPGHVQPEFGLRVCDELATQVDSDSVNRAREPERTFIVVNNR